MSRAELIQRLEKARAAYNAEPQIDAEQLCLFLGAHNIKISVDNNKVTWWFRPFDLIEFRRAFPFLDLCPVECGYYICVDAGRLLKGIDPAYVWPRKGKL